MTAEGDRVVTQGGQEREAGNSSAKGNLRRGQLRRVAIPLWRALRQNERRGNTPGFPFAGLPAGYLPAADPASPAPPSAAHQSAPDPPEEPGGTGQSRRSGAHPSLLLPVVCLLLAGYLSLTKIWPAVVVTALIGVLTLAVQLRRRVARLAAAPVETADPGNRRPD